MEIQGLPIPEKNSQGIMVTTYAVHTKIKKILDWVEEDPDCKILLFFDELNRSERSVMSELMNLILNREINGIQIPDNVSMVAAINPSSSTNGFEGNTDYGVTDMDAASKNRLIWLYLTEDTTSWLDWAIERPGQHKEIKLLKELKEFNPEDYETRIHEDIIEFISKMPHMLNNPLENVDVSASLRTWEFASDILRTYEANKNAFKQEHLGACLAGCIGNEAYTTFTNFLENNDNPLIDPEDFFARKDGKIDKKLLDRFEQDTIPRQRIMAKNMARFLNDRVIGKDGNKPEAKLTKNDVARVCKVFNLMAIDNKLAVMRDISATYEELHDKLTEHDEYLNMYTDSLRIVR